MLSTTLRGRMGEHSEGRLAKMIEQQTAKLPLRHVPVGGLWSILGSLALKLMGEDKKATIIGQWVPTVLILGLYNKIVKTHGSE
jgi:hypothetical protein